MAMIEGWPLYYKDGLKIGNLESNVSISTLWTEKERILNNFQEDSYAICGNLYSLWGINFIVRNILANPKVRYIVLCGADLSGSGEALLNLFKRGVNENHVIINSRARIDPKIPLSTVEKLRRSVDIFDLREVKDLKKINAKIRKLHSQSLPPFAEPQVFPETKPSAEVLNSEKTGFKVEDETVAGAWLKVLKLVMNFGGIKPSEYSVEQKELLNVIVVIMAEDPENIFFPPWLPTTKKELEDYYPRVLRSAQLPLLGMPVRGVQLGFWGEYYHAKSEAIPGVSYTYGGRLRNYRGVSHDQIKVMIEKLRETSYTRRAVAITWDPLVDGAAVHPPCLIQLLTNVQQKELFLTAHFRSHDIYGAWPENVFALRKLQKYIASKLEIPMGPLTIVSHSAHIYADKWQVVREILDKYYPETPPWKDDPRGNFHICIEDDMIVVEHGMTVEGKSGIQFKGQTAREIYLSIINKQLISLLEHAAYLGSELKKAEFALKLGLEYRQDQELSLKFLKRL